MSTPTFSESLRLDSPEWLRLQEHPFFLAIYRDALPEDAFRRYLLIEHAFVGTAVRIFAYALTKAPDREAESHLVRILAGLTDDQMGFFAEAFEALGLTPASPDDLPPGADALEKGMLGIAAAGSFDQISVAMLAAEWTYLTASERALRSPPRDPHLTRWLEIHVTDPFRGQVRWLRDRVDQAVKQSPALGSDLRKTFRTALTMEVAFHDAAMERS
jgi:thiaminase (transcriptional activator TenA)